MPAACWTCGFVHTLEGQCGVVTPLWWEVSTSIPAEILRPNSYQPVQTAAGSRRLDLNSASLAMKEGLMTEAQESLSVKPTKIRAGGL